MTTRDRIEQALRDAFSPDFLDVIDESHRHIGHQPGMTGEGTHMRVRIIAPAFAGVSRIARHRAINAVLKPETDAGLHALAIEPAAPGEETSWA